MDDTECGLFCISGEVDMVWMVEDELKVYHAETRLS